MRPQLPYEVWRDELSATPRSNPLQLAKVAAAFGLCVLAAAFLWSLVQ